MLTLYVIPGHPTRDSVERVTKSIMIPEIKIEVLPDRMVSEACKTCSTDWWMYIYGDEVIGAPITRALPVFLAEGKFDILRMFKMYMENEKIKVSRSARLFRAGVPLEDGLLIPKGKWVMETMLDGYIFGMEMFKGRELCSPSLD